MTLIVAQFAGKSKVTTELLWVNVNLDHMTLLSPIFRGKPKV